MRAITESEWLVALHHVPGVGWHTIHKIKEVCQSFAHLPDRLKQHAAELEALRLPWRSIAEELTSYEMQKKMKRFQEKRIDIVTVLDGRYPELLREIAQPPWVLYVVGDASLLSEPALAIVGTRHPSHYGKTVARKLAYQLAKRRWVVVSGMAIGIDSEAHLGALEAEGKTIAVLGSGVDVIYPKSGRDIYRQIVERGAVVSEFPPGTRPRPGHFPQRNRIISGLSRGSVIVEAEEKSGSLITAEASLEQNRDVFAIPGPITSRKSVGPHRLIQQGAKCVTTLEDILEEYPDVPPQLEGAADALKEQTAPLTAEEAAVLVHIEAEPVHIDVLVTRTELSLAELHPILLSLQVKQLIKQLPGSQFVRM